MVSLMVIILDASAQSRESRNDHHRSADDAETDTDYYSLGHYFFFSHIRHPFLEISLQQHKRDSSLTPHV